MGNNQPASFERYGTLEEPVIVMSDVIIEALSAGQNIDIRYAFVRGGLPIRENDYRFAYNNMLGNDLEITIAGTVRVSDCDIMGDVNCINVIFNESVDFSRTNFRGRACFDRARICRLSRFDGVHFSSNPDLRNAVLTDLSPNSLDEIGEAYRNSSILDASYFFEEAGKRYLNTAEYTKSSESFRNAKLEYDKEGKYDDARRMYVKEKESIRKSWRSWRKSILYCLWKITCNYGESYWRFIGWMVFIIFGFALIYSPYLDHLKPDWMSITFKEYPYGKGNDFITALYFSIVTFATLGFGDITPFNDAGKVLVILEVLAGYVMLGVLITLVARKMTKN